MPIRTHGIKPENLKLVAKKVMVMRDEDDDKVDGIVLPETSRGYTHRAEVLKVSDDIAELYTTGDIVLYLKEYAVTPLEDIRVAIVRGDKIIARVEEQKGLDYEVIIPQNGYVLVEPEPSDAQVGHLYITNPAKSNAGRIIMFSDTCETVRVTDERVIYFFGTAILCSEDDKLLHLIHEDDILCVGDITE